MHDVPDGFDLSHVDNAFWVLTQPTSNPAYDFSFEAFFACRRPWKRPEQITAIARVGAPHDYEELVGRLATLGITLINSVQQHFKGSELPEWYPLIEDLTPKSLWFDTPPPASSVADLIGWPVFVKGARQTSRHDSHKCIARSATEYEKLVEQYADDEILGWQRCVIRQFVDLRPVAGDSMGKVRPSFEFRTFWWFKELVGAGLYWSQFGRYSWTDQERDACLTVARAAVARIDCPFLVVDMAQDVAGRWIVIECNDAQESGYAGVSPFALWNGVISASQSTRGGAV